MNNQYKSGFVGLVGFPNAGKSTFLNKIVEEKISIVTNKPQTTRRRIQGIVNLDDGQIVFVDSPGVTKPTTKLNEFLKSELEDIIKNSDALVCILPVDEKKEESINAIIKMVSDSGKPWIAVINKVDLAKLKHRCNIIVRKLEDLNIKTFQVSSLGKSFPEKKLFMNALLEILPESQGPLFEDDIITPHSYRELVAEMIREQCFENLSQELPYQLAVLIRKYDESAELIKIFADIIVERENHKGIVVGYKGTVVKKIGEMARAEIEKLTGGKVYLELKVVCKDQWSSQKNLMKELGYVVGTDE